VMVMAVLLRDRMNTGDPVAGVFSFAPVEPSIGQAYIHYNEDRVPILPY